MNSTTLICKQCKAPLEYEEGSAVLHCPHCGYTEKIDESDEITRERIIAKAYKDTELGKSQIEKDAAIEEKKIKLEEKNLGVKKVKYIIIAILVVIAVALVGLAVYSGQHKGKINLMQTSKDYIGTDYQLAHRLLAEAGFENIEEVQQANLTKKEQELEGKVVRVSIDGNSSFDVGWYSKDAAVTIFYRVLDPARANDIQMPLSRTDCIGKNYQTVADKLTAEGFHNIKIVPYADLSMDRKKEDGKITRITINYRENFYLGDYFAADSLIQIDYHTLDPERKTDVQIPASYNSFPEMDYLAACKEFRTAGFTNITLIPKYDVRFYEGSKSGVVQSISVNGENTFLKGVWLPFDTEVRITYRTKNLKYIGENYQEISKVVSSMGFADIELLPLNDLDTNELKKDGQVESVLIGDTELGASEEMNLLSHVVIQYHSEKQANNNQVKITASSKELTGKNYEDVVSVLQALGFTCVRAVALEDLSNEIISKNGDVKEISIDGTTKFSVGRIFDKTVEVIVAYHSLKSKPTPTPEPDAEEGQVKLTVALKELKGKQYEEVLSLLQEMGFTNITVNPLGDIKKGWLHDEGEVKGVSIGGTTRFSVNDIFDNDVEIIISYHSFPE